MATKKEADAAFCRYKRMMADLTKKTHNLVQYLNNLPPERREQAVERLRAGGALEYSKIIREGLDDLEKAIRRRLIQRLK